MFVLAEYGTNMSCAALGTFYCKLNFFPVIDVKGLSFKLTVLNYYLIFSDGPFT